MKNKKYLAKQNVLVVIFIITACILTAFGGLSPEIKADNSRIPSFLPTATPTDVQLTTQSTEAQPPAFPTQEENLSAETAQANMGLSSFPNGEILKHANAETGQVETSARVLKAN